MKPRNTVSSYVLLVGVMGLSIVGGIFAYQVFSSATKSQITAEQKEAIKSLDGSINQKVIDSLSKRVMFNEYEIMSPIIIAGSTPEASGSATEQ